MDKTVTLQGCEVKLKNLVDEYSDSTIDYETAVKIIKINKIEVGMKPQSLDQNIQFCYISRSLQMGAINKKAFTLLIESDIFFKAVKNLIDLNL
jgi:hypothetical protein